MTTDGSLTKRHNALLRVGLKAVAVAAVGVATGFLSVWLGWQWLGAAAYLVVLGAILTGFGVILAAWWNVFRSVFGGSSDK